MCHENELCEGDIKDTLGPVSPIGGFVFCVGHYVEMEHCVLRDGTLCKPRLMMGEGI